MSKPLTLSLITVSLFAASSAFAAPRAYVASYGNDANVAASCSPTAPCRNFAAAMPVVDLGGQIVVLDSAGYGAINITKSLSIIAPDGVYAGLTAASGNVVNIAAAGLEVTLKGLMITGGTNGINMTAGAKLNVENCIVAQAANMGISVQTSAKVTVARSVVRDNYVGIWGGNNVTMDILNSQVTNNVSEGIYLHGGTAGTSNINVTDTLVTGAAWCIDNYADTGTNGFINVTRSTMTGCGYGILNEAQGTGIITVSDSMITRNNFGVVGSTGTIETLGNNHVRLNNNNFGGSITTVPAF